MSRNLIASVERIRESRRTGRCRWASVLLAMLPFLVPAGSLAGTINVTSNGDDNTPTNSDITLREALLIAKGERDAFRDNNPDTVDETDHIDGSVGEDDADTINVPASIGTIILTSVLPALDNSTDGIFAASAVVLEGSATGAPAFTLSTNNHTIIGFTLRGFGTAQLGGLGEMLGAVEISGSGNTIQGMVIENSRAQGIRIHGRDAKDNTVSNCIVDGAGASGILIIGGANGNTLENVFAYNGAESGILISGEGTDGNSVIESGMGMTAELEPAGNEFYGISISGGAKNNRLGDPNEFKRVTYVSFNGLGGIKISGNGTDGNILHSLWLGFDKDDGGGSGNGFESGITVSDGAKDNEIGQPGDEQLIAQGQDPQIIISGHDKNGIVITGVGTEGNNIQRVFIGGPNPGVPGPNPGDPDVNVQGVKMKNKGHGIVIEDGARSMFIGGEMELAQVEINYTTGREFDPSPKHALFINGNNSAAPIEDVTIGTIHFGNERVNETDPVFTGDGIHVTGNVDGVEIGQEGHHNHVNGAAGYGIMIDGPNVTDVTMFQVHVGNRGGTPAPNALGGIMIQNGAKEITIGDSGDDSRCIVASNGGPGITIDASGTAPETILIRNTYIGLDEFGAGKGNDGPGILVKGPTDGAAVALTDVQIGAVKDDFGDDDAGLGNVISANKGNGIELSNVSNVEIFANRIGTDKDGKVGTGNEQNGILVDGGSNIKIGADQLPDIGGNIISGNKKNGVLIDNNASDVKLLRNKIGTGPDPDTRANPNPNAIENPNEEHDGVSIRGGATLTVVKENFIRYNKEHGIRVNGAETKHNRFENNSIHRNGKEGIRLEDGANGGIKPPKVDRLMDGSKKTAATLSGITFVADADVEVFVDPLAADNEDGYYGQGKERVSVPRTNAMGEFTIPLRFAQTGIITATVTDSDGNTSEFSPYMQGIVIQTVNTRDDAAPSNVDKLVANKPTVVRVFANTGKAGLFQSVTGTLSIDGGGADRPEPRIFLMSALLWYAGHDRDRKRAVDSLNFYVDEPAAGNHTLEVTFTQGERERGRLDMGSFEFKTIEVFTMAVVPVRAPHFDGVSPPQTPARGQVRSALRYLNSCFPFAPGAFNLKVMCLPTMVIDYLPHRVMPETWAPPTPRVKLAMRLEAARARAEFSDGTTPRYVFAFVSPNTRFEPSGLYAGYVFPAFPNLVHLLDTLPVPTPASNHNGSTLVHELGHTPPFLLSDTYAAGSLLAPIRNPVSAVAGESDRAGNFVLEEHYAFVPKKDILFNVYGLKGPIWSDVAGGNLVHDFMGGGRVSWIDPTTYKVLFDELAGGIVRGTRGGSAQLAVSPAMLVQGSITTDDVVTLSPVVRKTGPVDRLELPTGGNPVHGGTPGCSRGCLGLPVVRTYLHDGRIRRGSGNR